METSVAARPIAPRTIEVRRTRLKDSARSTIGATAIAGSATARTRATRYARLMFASAAVTCGVAAPASARAPANAVPMKSEVHVMRLPLRMMQWKSAAGRKTKSGDTSITAMRIA